MKTKPFPAPMRMVRNPDGSVLLSGGVLAAYGSAVPRGDLLLNENQAIKIRDWLNRQELQEITL